MSNPKPRPAGIGAHVRDLLDYDANTGALSWRRNRPGGAKAGQQITCRMGNGYIKTNISPFGVLLAHQIVWAICAGAWPRYEIDHINGDRADNRIANLRELPNGANSQNLRGAKSSSKSGVLGVTRVSDGTWAARIASGGKKSGRHLGCFKSPEEAHAAYVRAKRVLHEANTL